MRGWTSCSSSSWGRITAGTRRAREMDGRLLSAKERDGTRRLEKPNLFFVPLRAPSRIELVFPMGTLAQISDAVEAYDRHVDEQVRRARTDEQFRRELLARWEQVRRGVPTVTTPTGISLPRVA